MPRPPQKSGRPGLSMAGQTNKRPVLNLPRQAAVRILNGVMTEHKQLSELTQSDDFQALAPEDRARSQRLATHTLRHVGRADRALRPHLAKLPAVEVLNILRLGLVEIAGLGAPAHAVVNDLVSICAASNQTRPYKGLINAVLRKAVADVTGKWDKSPVQMLPKWLRNPLREAYGNGTIMAIETAHMRGAPVDLTVTGDLATWASTLGGTPLENGSLRLGEIGQISALEGFAEGKWWVQDAAAAWPAAALAVTPGETILDVCAAPGGKTMQLAAQGGVITAGNASQITDGAAAVLVCNESGLKKIQANPRAEIVSISVVGDDPVFMLTGPIPASKKALEAANLSIDDIDLYEVNEAFAPVPLAWAAELHADKEKLNVNGGAMALGHPLGATGAKLMTTLLHEMERRESKYGLQAICEGGGTANATIIKRVS